jgi:hypothetical protein
MKLFLLGLLFTLTSFCSFSQQQNEPSFFAQCMLTIDNQEEFNNLTAILQGNPYVKVVRLDWISHRLFLMTRDINQLPLATFKSWLGVYDTNAECIQIGLHGTDLVNPYPFVNCPN